MLPEMERSTVKRIFKPARRTIFLLISVYIILQPFAVQAKESKEQQQLKRIKEYMAANPDSLPLVIGIPGFRVPGVTIPQEGHFGELGNILESWGIPYYCMVYDSDDYPLRMVADLASDNYSIATTRVIPTIVRTIKFEQERRAKEGLPPVKDVIMFMYSQGTVVSYGFVRQLHYFRRQYMDYLEEFGAEWEALLKDPEFLSVMFAMDNFTLIKNIQVQRERDFERDPDLRLFYDRTKEQVEQKYTNFVEYLIDPSTLFPNVLQFDPPETGKYPKKYPKIREYGLKCRQEPEEKQRAVKFMQDYSLLRNVREINFMYFSTSGSIFGSPHANAGYDLLQTVKFGQMVVKGVNQIKDTRLGSFHHTRKISNLVRESKIPGYPISKENTLFVVGANEEQGDGLVDQPSAHISGHGLVELNIEQKPNAQKSSEPIMVKMEVLPEQYVVPLEVHHFPVKTFWGLGPTHPGSAYMEPGHPVLDYLIPFMYKDFKQLEKQISENDIYLRQFMFEFTFRHITAGAETEQQIAERRESLLGGLLPTFIKELDVRIENKPINIDIQGKFFNADNLTYVIVGSYKESIFFEDKPEEISMDFAIRARGYDPILLTLPVRAGKIVFVNINLNKSNGDDLQ
jgi:hypothetical protein